MYPQQPLSFVSFIFRVPAGEQTCDSACQCDMGHGIVCLKKRKKNKYTIKVLCRKRFSAVIATFLREAGLGQFTSKRGQMGMYPMGVVMVRLTFMDR